MYVIFILFCFLFFLAQDCHTVSWSTITDEVFKVSTIYNGTTSVIPLQDQSNTMNVSIGMQLLTLNGFDDIGGIMDINVYLSIEWTEEIYSNTYGTSAPDALVTISAASIWKPSLILVNAAGVSSEILKEQSQVNIYLKSGKCEWAENIELQGSCRPNVYLYPVDIHDCLFTFTSRAYKSSRLTILTSSFMKKINFEDHVAWTVEKMAARTFIYDSKSYAEFQIKIQRRSLNFILNYILPIGILSVLNVFVFILPRSSGERAGYSVTCFLAFVVFMNTIITSLPKSSSPLPVLVYFLTVMMTISAVITITVLLTLMIEKKVIKQNSVQEMTENHHEDNGHTIQENNDEEGRIGSNNETSNQQRSSLCCYPSRVNDVSSLNHLFLEPPRFLRTFASICRRLCCIFPNDVKKMRWVEVGNTLDVVFFIFFLAFEVIFTIGFISPASKQYFENKAQIRN